MDGKSLAETTNFRYLGMGIVAFGWMKEDIDKKIAERERVLSSLKGKMKRRIYLNN